LSDIGVVEQAPVQDGRNMTMLLAPSRAILASDDNAGDADGQSGSRKKSDRRRETEAQPAASDAAA
jgi:translation initiation factor IF-3